MNYNINLKSIGAFLLLIVAISCNPGYNVHQSEGNASDKLVPFTFYTLDDVEFTNSDLKQGSKLMVYYTDPRCSYCHDQTLWLIDNMENMEDVQVIVISSRNRNQTASLKERYQFDQFDNLIVLYDKHDILVNTYFIDISPYILIFNEEGRLVRTFSGLTEMDLVNNVLSKK